MLSEVSVIDAEPRILAVVKRTANLTELPAVMADAFDQVWPFLRANSIPAGQNVVLYHDQLMNLEIGVEVFAPLPPDEQIVVFTTPRGRAATVAHWGPYEELTLAHTAIARQCIARGFAMTGLNWEVYGDWSEDPMERRTDVFYQLGS